MKGLLTLKKLSENQIKEIIEYALLLKSGKIASYEGKKMATLFFENSTRTQYSFQTAMLNLNIKVLSFNASASSVNKGETLYDTVKTFESLGLDGLVIRHSKDKYYEELENCNIPIINGGDGKSDHPTQSLLDLMTIYEEFGHFEGLKVTIFGDIAHSRVAHSNIEVMERLGMKVYITGPEEFIDDKSRYIDYEEALRTSDVVMLLRVQFERLTENMSLTNETYFNLYGLTKERVSMMKENAIIMHPAPVNRGIEIADDVVEDKKSRIFKQMTNGVYVRMAVISKVLDGEL